MIDRKKIPHSKPVENIQFPQVEQFHLFNGIPVYTMNAGTLEIIKIDLIFEAGQWFSDNLLTAVFCNRMLIEGSKKFSSLEIAEKFDYYGTFSNFECGRHFAHVQLFSLCQFFEKSIEILEDFIKNPVFPEDKLKVLVQNEMQQYVVSREKTEVLAADEFIPRIFGTTHPYGRIRKLSDYENLELEQIKAFHKRYYNASNCKIMVSGKLNGEIKPVLEKYFGNDDWKGQKTVSIEKDFEDTSQGKFFVQKPDAVQSTIMIGKRIINKKHADYFGLSILDTILGGYFGSRLMSNLREKNALTYGVYSGLSSLLHAGSLTISANVKSDLYEKAVEQIYKEIEILQKELVSNEELQMVKNYLSGEMLRSFDGPIALSEIFIDLLAYGLNFDYYKQYFDTLKSIKPQTIRDLAVKYLDRESFVEVVAGSVN